MKIVSSHSVLAQLGVVVVFAAFVISVHAQQRVFKVGDRVSASPSSLRDERYWRPCTVTEVHNFTPKRSYSLTCDGQNGGSPSSFLVNEDWVRPLAAQAVDAGKGTLQNAGGMPRQNNVRPQDGNGPVACFASDPDTNGRTVMEVSFRGAVRKNFEREPRPGEDGRVTVSIQSLTVGASHAYRLYEDPDDARGKTIYPVRATFTTCTDYFRRIETVKRERAFACYKNAAGEWVCDIRAAVNTNMKDETKSMDKQR
jgi:hypothetical protein